MVREDDLPGSEAPAVWLICLKGSSAANLRRVVQHDAQDIKSLARVDPAIESGRCYAAAARTPSAP